MVDRIKDPNQVPVQLNISVPFEFREHLHDLARERRTSVTQLCREALLTFFPLHKGVGRGSRTDATEPQASA